MQKLYTQPKFVLGAKLRFGCYIPTTFAFKTQRTILLSVYIIFLFALIFSFTSCSKNSNGLTEPIGSGIYLYTSFDTSGTTIVEGKFTMILTDSNSIIGKWDFKQIGDPGSIGPQFGTGDLVGSFEQNKIWIELNPQFRDNNLRLSGTINNNKYSGTWQWISIVGITNYGTFEAIKVF